MDPVRLDPRAYGGTYKLVGGQPSLDLVNTLSWPGRSREHDWFDPAENITRWAVAAGILGRDTAQRLADSLIAEQTSLIRQLGKVRRTRSTVADVLVPYIHGHVPSQQAVAAFNRLLVRATARRHLHTDTLTWTYREPTTFDEVLAPAVINTAEVLTSVDPARLGHCPSCDWLFHDTSRNGRRTWCDMADCGTREKARQHYRRQHPEQRPVSTQPSKTTVSR